MQKIKKVRAGKWTGLLRVGLGLLALSPIALSASLDFRARTRSYGPRLPLVFSKPTIRWEIWSEEGPVVDRQMTVDGQTVDAMYDEERRCLCYSPASPLSAGSHHVHCKIVFAPSYAFEREWDVTVAPKALPELPARSALQNAALKEANRIRAELGLAPFMTDPRFDLAAQTHAEYMESNHIVGHAEAAGSPSFLGADPGARLETCGWVGAAWEGLTKGVPEPEEAIRHLYQAPYHRIPFLQPGTVAMGFGKAGSSAVADFEFGFRSGVTVSPADGEQGVPLDWNGTESPNPRRIHGSVDGRIGYPIVFAAFGRGKSKLAVKSAALYEGNDPVPCYLNEPAQDDFLQQAAFLLPKAPLKPGTTYRVVFDGLDSEGATVVKKWSFTTRAAP